MKAIYLAFLGLTASAVELAKKHHHKDPYWAGHEVENYMRLDAEEDYDLWKSKHQSLAQAEAGDYNVDMEAVDDDQMDDSEFDDFGNIIER
jgi:hypothetical protein